MNWRRQSQRPVLHQSLLRPAARFASQQNRNADEAV